MGFGVRGMGKLSREIYKEMSLQATDWDSWRRQRARIRFSVKIGGYQRTFGYEGFKRGGPSCWGFVVAKG